MSKFWRVMSDLKDKIHSGDLDYGQRLDSTAEIAKTYDVSYPTAHKVLRALAEQGYLRRQHGQGTFVAKRVRLARSKIGLIMHTEGHLFGELAHELFHGLAETGCSLEVVPLADGGGTPHEAGAIEKLVESNPYAIVVEGSLRGERRQGLISRALASSVPVVWTLCEEAPAGLGGHVVSFDHFLGFQKIAEHLVGLGHRRIAGFAIDEYYTPQRAFARAISQCRRRHPDMELVPILTGDGTDYDRFLPAVTKALTGRDRFTAVMCSLDARAKVVVNAADELGLCLPEDLAVTGFYNTPWAASCKLTTVDVHVAEIGRTIANLLSNNGLGRRQARHRILIEPELIVRGSTVRPGEDRAEASRAAAAQAQGRRDQNLGRYRPAGPAKAPQAGTTDVRRVRGPV